MNRNVTKEILDTLCHICPEISKIFLFVRDRCVLPDGNRTSWYPGNCRHYLPVIDRERTTDTAFCNLIGKEADKVKKVAGKMLNLLKQEKLVLDWRKKQQTRADVRLCIEECLDYLPERFEKSLFQQKCEIVYQYIFDMYPGAGQTAVVM